MATCLLKRVKANTNYFYLEATVISDFQFLSAEKDEPVSLPKIYYSLNSKKNWIEYTFNNKNEGKIITLHQNDKCYFKGDNETFSTEYYKEIYLQNYSYPNSELKAGGNIMSLIDSTMKRKDVPDYCFYKMFERAPIISPPELPATEVGDSAYFGMFRYCEKLELPANFRLPATKLYDSCYSRMFEGCKLLKLPESFILPVTKLPPRCYRGMFEDCWALDHINKNILPAQITTDSCYDSMFMNTSLKVPCDLPAVVLKQLCYSAMFYGTYIKISDVRTAEYTKEYRIPSNDDASVVEDLWSFNMFARTPGTYTEDPLEANTTYYIDPQE